MKLYAQPQIVVNILNFFKHFEPKKLRFPEVYEVSGGFRNLREACRNNFHQVSSKSTRWISSYDPKTQKFHDY